MFNADYTACLNDLINYLVVDLNTSKILHNAIDIVNANTPNPTICSLVCIDSSVIVSPTTIIHTDDTIIIIIIIALVVLI